jgi:hypothetical protein
VVTSQRTFLGLVTLPKRLPRKSSGSSLTDIESMDVLIEASAKAARESREVLKRVRGERF